MKNRFGDGKYELARPNIKKPIQEKEQEKENSQKSKIDKKKE